MCPLDQYERFGIYAALPRYPIIHIGDDGERAYCGRVFPADQWVETHLCLKFDSSAWSMCYTCEKVQAKLMQAKIGY